MHRKLARLLVAVALSLPALAHARPSPAARDDGDCAKARAAGRTCQLVIDGDELEGERAAAGDAPLWVRDFADHTSLVRVRRDFLAEIVSAAERL